MKEDPVSKSQISSGIGGVDRSIPKIGRGGNISTDKDYSSLFKTQRSRIAFIAICVLPYLASAIYLFFTADVVIAIIMLFVPLSVGIAFWLLLKRIS